MKFAGKSDLGKTRTSNQDEYVILQDKNENLLAVVCDGVGGANHGETASRLAVSNMTKKFEDNEGFKDLEDAQAWLFSAIKQTNQLVVARGNENKEYKGMGTTLVCFLKTKYGSLIANVGDSRAYALYDDKSFRQISHDHSYVANLVDSGQITIQEAMIHPQRHVITNAIGIWDDLVIDFFKVEKEVSLVLLCSDGLHDYVSEHTITTILKDKRLSAETKVSRLINAADEAGGYDNCTAIIIQLGGND